MLKSALRDSANWRTKKTDYKFSRLCLDDNHFKKEGLESVEELSKVSMWNKLMKNVDTDEPTTFLDHVYLGCTQRECKSNEGIVDES